VESTYQGHRPVKILQLVQADVRNSDEQRQDSGALYRPVFPQYFTHHNQSNVVVPCLHFLEMGEHLTA
jgi:hypothetical protein